MPVGPTDEELLVSADPRDFGLFYARHLPGVESYFARRVGRDAAADLASETFAAALVARRRFVPGPTPAAGWLYTIAARRLVDDRRRGLVQQRALEALISEVEVRDPAATSSGIADELDAGLLRHLPRKQREAIVAHVIRERDYGQIAAQSRASEASIRQRVSRGLSELRRPLQLYRASQQLAHEGAYLQIRRRARQGLALPRAARAARLLIFCESHPVASEPISARPSLELGAPRRELGSPRRRAVRHRLGKRGARLDRVQARRRSR